MSNYFLLIDSSESKCSACVFKDEVCIREIISQESNDASSNLTLYIQQLMDEAGISLSDLQAIGVFSGPGSYTGLRIAISTAKGLCYSLNKPLISINTMEAMLNGFLKRNAISLSVSKEAILLAMMDARRMEVYVSGYDVSKKLINKLRAQVLDLEYFKSIPFKNIFCFGSGASKCSSIEGLEGTTIVDSFDYSSSDGMESFFKKYNNKEFEDIAYFEPLYLKEFYTPAKK